MRNWWEDVKDDLVPYLICVMIAVVIVVLSCAAGCCECQKV